MFVQLPQQREAKTQQERYVGTSNNSNAKKIGPSDKEQ